MQGTGTSDAGDLFGQGFRLAYFIVPEREAALRVLADAANRLKARCRQESKRAYWRDKYLKRWGSKINRADADTLQWLIYFAAEKYEKELERSGKFSTQDLAIRYIKCLVQTTTAMSSFYVGIGLHRLLHNYSTTEVQRMYELMTERYLGADEYRRAKRLLMNKVSDRFGALLSTATVAHGETRFEPCWDQGSWLELVRECLVAFVPWSTWGHCLLPANAAVVPGSLSGQNTTLDLDTVEVNRCHALIEPTCFARLTEMLRLDSPDSRLALPKFQRRPDINDDKLTGSRESASLTGPERAAIQERLNAESGRRRSAPSNIVRVLVDGVEEAQLNPREQSDLRCSLNLGTKIIELWTTDAHGKLLLGTHLLSYENGVIQASTSRVEMGGANLTLAISAGGTDETAWLRLTCAPAKAPMVSTWFRTLQYAALSLVLITAGWILGVESGGRSLRLQRAQIDSMEHAAGAKVSREVRLQPGDVPAAVTQRLVPYDGTRGGEALAAEKVRIAAGTAVVHLDFSVAGRRDQTLTAVLRMFPQRTLILSETLMQEDASSNTVARLSVPTTLLTRDKAYLVELTSAGANGRQENVGTYIFQVVGESR